MSNNNFTSAGIKLNIDVKDANRDLGNVSNKLEKALAGMELSAKSFSNTWGDLTRGIKDTKRIVSGILISQAFYTISSAVTEASLSVLNFSKNMETAGVSLEYFVKGANKAAKAQAFLREMNKFAAKTPFKTEEALAFSRYMQAVGISMGTTKSFLKVVTDTSAATGATAENLQRVVFALGQMKTKGRIANEEIRQLANANIPIYEILREELNLTGEQISKIGKYWVNSDKAIVAILRGLEKRYGGAADRVSDTMSGMTDTIKDNAKIVAQIATSGAYDKLKDKLTTVRDALDRYREISTVQGAGGLLRQMLLDIDATGQLGTRILAFIGNTKQLGAALKNLYITAAPIRTMLGTTLYMSVTALTVGVTGLTTAVNRALKALGRMGITSRELGGILASLFITYKVGSWMAFLGQGAATATLSLYRLGEGMIAVLPAALRANAGVTALTLGLSGLVIYTLAAKGVFDSLINTFAGLDAAKTNGNLLPDDFEEAFREYEAEYAKYQAAIEKYQADFNAPFEEIDDGSQDAVDGLEDISKESKKAAKSVKNDWLAAFDEVYTIPKDIAGSMKNVVPPDFGLSVIPPTFRFPKFKEPGLKEPKFDFKEVFNDSPFTRLNSDVLDPKFWERLLPFAITFGLAGIGRAYRNRPGYDGSGTGRGGPGGSGGGSGRGMDAFKSAKENLANLKNAVKSLTDMEEQIKTTLDEIEAGNTTAYEKLKLQAEQANRTLENIRRYEALTGRNDKQIVSKVLEEANEKLAIHDINDTLDTLVELEKRAALDTAQGDLVRKQLKETVANLNKAYIKNSAYLEKYPEVLNRISRYIDTGGTEGRRKTLIDTTKRIYEALQKGNGDALNNIGNAINNTYELAKKVEKELIQLGITDKDATQAINTIKDIKELFDKHAKRNNLSAEIDTLREMIANSTAYEALGKAIDVGGLKLQVATAERAVQKLDGEIKNLTSALFTSTDEVKNVQRAINNNNLFHNTVSYLDAHIKSLFRPLKMLEHYSSKILLERIDGRKALIEASRVLSGLPNYLKSDKQQGIKEALLDAGKMVNDALEKQAKPVDVVQKVLGNLSDAITDFGIQLGVSDQQITEGIEGLKKQIGKVAGTDEKLEALLTHIEKNTTQKPATSGRPSEQIFEYVATRLDEISDSAASLKDFDKKVLQLKKEIGNFYPEEAITHMERISGDVQIAREELAELLVINRNRSKPVKYTDPYKQLVEAQKEAVNTLNGNVKKLGEGIRHAWANPAEYVAEGIRKAGIFDPSRTALSGSDLASLLGQSGYGGIYVDPLISNILTEVRKASGIPEKLDTLISIANMISGQVAEDAIGTALSEVLSEVGYTLRRGDTVFNELRNLQAQLDYTVFNKGRFKAPIDVKAITNQEKIKNLLENVAEGQGKYFTIGAKSFNKFIDWSDDVAWQLAVQANVTGKQTAMLAVLDTKAVGIEGAILSSAAGINESTEEGRKLIEKLFKEQLYEQYATAIELGKIKDNIKIVEVSIPKWARSTVDEYAKLFAKAQLKISEEVAKGNATLKDLLTPINTLGEKIGDLTKERFASGAFNPPKVGNDAVNTLLQDIANDLKSVKEQTRNNAATKLEDLIDIINDKLWKNPPNSESQEITIPLGQTFTGMDATLTDTAHNVLIIRDKLVEFKTNMESRGTALTTSLSDTIKKINKLADDVGDIRLNTVVGKNAKGKDLTFKDLLMSILQQDKNLNGPHGSSIKDAVSSMLSGGAPVPIENPYAFADIIKFLETLSDAAGAAENLGNLDVPALSETDNIIAQFKELKEFGEFFKNIKKTTEFSIKNATVKATGFGSTHFSFGKATPGVPNAAGEAQYFDDAARYFATIGKNVFGSSGGSGGSGGGGGSGISADGFAKTFFLKTTTVTKILNALNNLAAGTKVVTNVADRYGTEQGYIDLVKQYNIKNPMYDIYDTPIGPSPYNATKPTSKSAQLPESHIDTVLSTLSWFDAFSTRSGSLNTVKDYFKMAPEEQMYFGKKYISDAKWQKGAIGGTLLGRGHIGDTFAETILKRTPGLISKKIKDPEAYLQEQLGSKSAFDAVVDYIVRSGDTTSETAKTFYKTYGQYMDTIVKPKYGMDIEWNEAVDLLLKNVGTELNKQLQEAGYGEVKDSGDVSIQMKPFFDSILIDLRDGLQKEVLTVLDTQRAYNTKNENPLVADWSRVISGADFSGISEQVTGQLQDELGITISAINEQFGNISIDSAKINDEVIGWTQRLPEDIKLDAATLSTSDVEILAQAGIQINGDGTITFMKAMNENMSGTNREITLTLEDVSKDVLDTLSKSGVQLNFGDGNGKIDLDVNTLSQKMTSALFRLNKNLDGQVSEDMQNALKGLGTVLESGYFEITNNAVLNGDMTIAEYIASMGKAADRLSPEVRAALIAIDEIIAQGSDDTSTAVATWADAVVMKSPISAEKLTPEIEAAFAEIGITFEKKGDVLYMITNQLGEKVKNGLSVIPKDIWDKLNPDVAEALKGLGVTMTEKAGFVMVDTSKVMDQGIADLVELYTNQPEVWDQIPEQIRKVLEESGIKAEDGMIRINTQVLDRMVEIKGNWYQYWDQLPDDVKKALGTSKLETENGLIKIEKITEDTKIPEDVDKYIIKPFNELPRELQDRLTGGDNSVRAALEGSSVMITGATNDAFVGMIQAVRSNFEEASKEAGNGAQNIADAIEKALREARKLENIQIKNSLVNKVTGKVTAKRSRNGLWTVTGGGKSYANIAAASEQEAINIARKRASELGLPSFKTGGIITGDGYYRAGEFGRVEAVLPLEDPKAMRSVATAITSSMPIDVFKPLGRAVGLENAGIGATSTRHTVHSLETAESEPATIVKNVAKEVLEVILPIIASKSNNDDRRPLYVGTLVADTRGLKELDRRMRIVALQEDGRRG